MNKTYIEIVIKENTKKDTNTNNNINSYSNSLVKSKLSTEATSEANIKYMKCINNISKQFKKNYVLIILTLIDISYLACIVVYFAVYRKKYLEINYQKPNLGIIGLKGSYYYSYKLDPNAQKPKEVRTYKKNMFSSINSDVQTINNNINNINNNIQRNKNIHNIKNKKTMTLEELSNRPYSNANYYNKNSKNKKDNINDNNDLNDYDLSEYLIAFQKDKRSFVELFKSISKKKQIFIFSLKNDQYFKLLKISLLPYCLINYFTTNVFFFTDKVIHQIYLDKGDYNFSYQLRIICLSALISSLFLYFGKYIFIRKNEKQMKHVIKCIDYSFVIIFLLFLFYWLYVGSYTSVFIKSQKHICFNFLLTIITCIIYELILTIISIILRKIALKKRNRPTLYKISIILILLKA